MLNINIGSSSYLPPLKNLWVTTHNNNTHLEFKDYNDISFLTDKNIKSQINVLILFLNDYLSLDNSLKDIKEKLDTLKNLIKSGINNKDNKCIIVISNYFYNNYLEEIKKRSEKEDLISEFIKEVRDFIKINDNSFYLDINKIFSEYGNLIMYENRNWYLSNFKLSYRGIKTLDKYLWTTIKKITFPSKKVLVLDCDNTLWGGVVGEDGYQNLKIGTDGIGKIFVDFQKVILEKKKQGIILALCSKNIEEDVWSVFDKNSSMILKKKDITAYEINWKNKSENIVSLSKKLNLGLDSFIFWDDNIIEREDVSTLSEVKVIDVPKEISDWPKYLQEMEETTTFSLTQEDKYKTEQYELLRKASSFEDNFLSKEDFLCSLKMKANIIKVSGSNINRASQLTIKTTQFNITNNNYNIDDLSKLNHEMYLCDLEDKFGKHGIIAFAQLDFKNNGFCILDNYILSCRAFGRRVEYWFLQKIFEILKDKKVHYLLTAFRSSKRNKPAKDFLEASGFKKSENYKQFFSQENDTEIFYKKVENINNRIDFFN